MKAIFIRRHGGLDQVCFEELETPKVRPGHVLVRTRAAALNALDLFVVGGLPGLDLEMPHILGSDGTGIVETVAEGTTRLKAGDRVMLNAVLSCGQCEFCVQGEDSMCIDLRLVGEHCHGTFAEYFLVPEGNLEKIPERVSFQEAAAFSLVFQTAWRMLKTRARIRPGEDVFIHGIGGGVSSAALQIVKFCGGRAFVSSSSDEKLQRAKELGADFGYNYGTANVVKEVLAQTVRRGMDIVFDTAGAATWLQSIKMVRKGGRIVTCGATTGSNPTTEIRLIFWKQIDILGSTMSNRREYHELLSLLRRGQLKSIIDKVFPLSEGKKALEYLNNQTQFGKVVLAIE